MKYIFYCFFAMMYGWCVPVAAQNKLGTPLLYSYSKADFEGGSRTWQIGQDSRGLMYFANNEGLIVFDGHAWSKHSLSNQTIVRSLFIDQHDRVYVGGQGEFGYFQADQRQSLAYTSLSQKLGHNYAGFADVWNTVGYQKAIFFRAHAAIFRLLNGKMHVYPAKNRWEFLGTAAGRLFAQDIHLGLSEFIDGKWHLLQGDPSLRKQLVTGVLSGDEDEVIITTSTDKMYILKGESYQSLPTRPSDAKDVYTPSVAKINDGEYVFASAMEGCLIRDARGNILQRISTAEGLPNNNVSSVFVDKQQNIWAGLDNAIALISYGSAIKYIRPGMDADVTGYSSYVKNERLYIASSNGLFAAPLSNTVQDHSQVRAQFSMIPGTDGGEAWHLDEVNKNLWLGHNRGVFSIDNLKAMPIATRTGTWNFLPWPSLNQDSGNAPSTLMGTYQGLDLFTHDPTGSRYQGALEGHLDSYRFLMPDTLDYIWASHPYRGIYQILVSSDRESYTTQLFTDRDGLPSSYQNYVFRWNGKAIFATEAGIYAFDRKEKVFKPHHGLNIFSGLPIRYIKQDEAGNIWFSSAKRVGVATYQSRPHGYQLIYFPEIEGLHTTGFENIYPYNANNTYVGAERGMLHINLEKYLENSEKPELVFSQVRVVGDKDSLLYAGFGDHTPRDKYHIPTLAADYNNFHFHYSSPSYGAHANLLYSFQLEGYDNQWSAWTSERQKAYTNLPSGDYFFRVKVKSNLGIESDVVSYQFSILAPWYATRLAWVIYTILLLCAFFLAVRWQRAAWLNRQRKHEEEINRMRYIYQLELDKNEREIIKLQKEHLEDEVLIKTKELASTSMQLMENADALHKLRAELGKIESGTADESDLKRITALLKDVDKNTLHWDQFAVHFDELNDGFLQRLTDKHPSLSRNDLKVCAYLRLHFTTKQIAQLQSISVRGVEVHRYRIRKKLNVDTQISLSSYLNSI
ncbi:triple tyrosine motif-containing protein [Sphingobacterium chungjuense]|uniref:triple tyrosine motif-containing protein n=1 Tax=Sphingobacterium chungjuense TaxID=2675553 RepID=UPI001408C1E6|nr:triple tyrosine motif-containing protein [Sphingobacterium chungjuense]